MTQEKSQVQIKSIKRKSLSKQVIDSIIDLLLSGQLKPGDKLPPEMELMEMLFVSRPVLREAMSSLETIGLITRKTREGTFLTEKIGSNPFRIMLALSSGDIHSIMETRLSQELGLISLAAEKITNDDLSKIEGTIEMMETSLDDYSKADREFHKIIAHRGSNPITEGIIDPLINMFDKTLQSISIGNRDKTVTIQQHKDIYEALKKKDPIESYIMMFKHLDHVRKRIQNELKG